MSKCNHAVTYVKNGKVHTYMADEHTCPHCLRSCAMRYAQIAVALSKARLVSKSGRISGHQLSGAEHNAIEFLADEAECDLREMPQHFAIMPIDYQLPPLSRKPE